MCARIPGKVQEGYEDSNELGAGDKLLHLLNKWDIQNVVLIVTRQVPCVSSSNTQNTIASSMAVIITMQDAGVPGRLGQQRFRVLLDRAKAVLEQCYLDAMEPGQW